MFSNNPILTLTHHITIHTISRDSCHVDPCDCNIRVSCMAIPCPCLYYVWIMCVSYKGCVSPRPCFSILLSILVLLPYCNIDIGPATSETLSPVPEPPILDPSHAGVRYVPARSAPLGRARPYRSHSRQVPQQPRRLLL